jgi:hypothetical protein
MELIIPADVLVARLQVVVMVVIPEDGILQVTMADEYLHAPVI